MKFSSAAIGLLMSSSFVAARKHVADNKLQKKPEKNSVEEVDLRFNFRINPEDITDEHLDYLEFAIQYAFDENNPNGMYKSTGVVVAFLKPDDDNKANNQDLQGGGELEWTFSKWYAHSLLNYGCDFCPYDDAFLSDTDNTLMNKKTLAKWAKGICDALNESSLDGFSKASGCVISLPYGGVGEAEKQEDEKLQQVAVVPNRVVHSGKKNSDSMAGEEEVDIHFVLDIGLDEVTDAHLDYLSLAIQLSFDETNRAHMYRSTGAQVDYMELEDDTKKEGLRSGNTVGWTFSKWYAHSLLNYGCDFCPHDDAFVLDSALGNEKTLKNWAKVLCDTLNDSPLEGFQDAKHCIIELPNGGVGAWETKELA